MPAQANEARNADFGQTSSTNPEMPALWAKTGDAGSVVRDTDVTFEGKASLRMEKPAAGGFVGVGQWLEGTPFSGKTVVVRAAFRAKNAQPGSVRIWIRGDPDRGFVSSAVPIALGDEGWVVHEAFLDVEIGASHLVYGATLGSAGTSWVSDVHVRIAPDGENVPSDESIKLLDEAIERIQQTALQADRVDWKAARAGALRRIARGDTVGGIRYLVAQLKDKHSFYMPAVEARIRAEDRRTDGLQLESEMVRGKAYVRIPGYPFAHVDRDRAFVTALRERIGILAAKQPCGWIVDLRANTGGNMHPMIDGLSGFLGNGPIGYYVGRSEKRQWPLTRVPGIPTAPDLSGARIAVLTGPRTASSGEVVTVAFRGRPHTRSFGQPTAGMSTANSTIKMSDGSLLLLMSSILADRTGASYGDAIAPDEVIEFAKGEVSTADDPVVGAAVNWHDREAKCSG
jgi:carboxyl-terminal processing protease